jgi:hypothetical protein
MLRRFAKLIALLLCLQSAGCRQPNADVELLESELRWLEDQLYLMDEQLQLKKAELESCRRSNASLKNLLASQQPVPRPVPEVAAPPTPETRPPTLAPPERRPLLDRLLPRSQRSRGSERVPAPQQSSGRGQGSAPRETEPDIDVELGDDVELELPSVDLGDDAADDPIGNTAPSDGRPAGEQGATRGPSRDAQIRQALHAKPRIALSPRVTGGYDFDDQAGDDGLMVLLHMFDATGQPRVLPGPLTLELHDPSAAPGHQLVARWELDASVVETRYGRSLFGEGVQLQLPWSDAPPSSSTLQLTATLLTEDGSWLTARHEVLVDLPPQASPAGEHRLDWQPMRPAKLFHGPTGAVPSEPSLLPDTPDNRVPEDPQS